MNQKIDWKNVWRKFNNWFHKDIKGEHWDDQKPMIRKLVTPYCQLDHNQWRNIWREVDSWYDNSASLSKPSWASQQRKIKQMIEAYRTNSNVGPRKEHVKLTVEFDIPIPKGHRLHKQAVIRAKKKLREDVGNLSFELVNVSVNPENALWDTNSPLNIKVTQQ